MVAKTRHPLRTLAHRIDEDTRAVVRDSDISPVVLGLIALIVLCGPFGTVLVVDFNEVPVRPDIGIVNVIGAIVGLAALFMACVAGLHYLRMRRLAREARDDIDAHLRRDADMLASAETVAKDFEAERRNHRARRAE